MHSFKFEAVFTRLKLWQAVTHWYTFTFYLYLENWFIYHFTTAHWSDESGDYVKPLWPLYVGLHICYNEDNNFRAKVPRNKCSLSTDRFLQFESVKEESPVIANQPSCGEQVLEFCTNRPSRSGSGLAARVLKVLCCCFILPCRFTLVGS